MSNGTKRSHSPMDCSREGSLPEKRSNHTDEDEKNDDKDDEDLIIEKVTYGNYRRQYTRLNAAINRGEVPPEGIIKAKKRRNHSNEHPVEEKRRTYTNGNINYDEILGEGLTTDLSQLSPPTASQENGDCLDDEDDLIDEAVTESPQVEEECNVVTTDATNNHPENRKQFEEPRKSRNTLSDDEPEEDEPVVLVAPNQSTSQSGSKEGNEQAANKDPVDDRLESDHKKMLDEMVQLYRQEAAVRFWRSRGIQPTEDTK